MGVISDQQVGINGKKAIRVSPADPFIEIAEYGGREVGGYIADWGALDDAGALLGG